MIKILRNEFPASKIGYTTNFGMHNDEILNEIFESEQDFITISLNTDDATTYMSLMNLEYSNTKKHSTVIGRKGKEKQQFRNYYFDG